MHFCISPLYELNIPTLASERGVSRQCACRYKLTDFSPSLSLYHHFCSCNSLSHSPETEYIDIYLQYFWYGCMRIVFRYFFFFFEIWIYLWFVLVGWSKYITLELSSFGKFLLNLLTFRNIVLLSG